jgi:hypothetical protein
MHSFDIRRSLFDIRYLSAWRIRFFKVSFPIRLAARGQRRRLYETSLFLFDQNRPLFRPAAALNPER